MTVLRLATVGSDLMGAFVVAVLLAVVVMVVVVLVMATVVLECKAMVSGVVVLYGDCCEEEEGVDFGSKTKSVVSVWLNS